MQIVIELSDETYKDIKEENSIYGINNGLSARITGKVVGAIQNGTPLPKGHGDLVDRDAINERFYAIYNDAMSCSNQPSDKYLLDKWSMCLNTTSTIIEADTGK